jgi:hypothetical protein
MVVDSCDDIVVFLTRLHDILAVNGYVLVRSSPNAEPAATGRNMLLRVSQRKNA